MKWRNQLLALFCVLVFFGFGVFYFQYWVIQKPFGIILFIGGGLDAHHLALARLQAQSQNQTLVIDGLPHTALLRNSSNDSATADVAAAATALATGVKVNNGAIAVDPEGNALSSLLDEARESGRMTGLVTTGPLTNPTAASFYGHAATEAERGRLAQQLVSADLDVVLGAGGRDFAAPDEHSGPSDNQDLLSILADNGYNIVRSLADLDEIPRWRRAKLFGLFTEHELASAKSIPLTESGGVADEQSTLAAIVRRAIELLQYNRGGYLLVVDAALMRKAAGENAHEALLTQTLELDRAVAVALEYAGAKSAVFVCGDVALHDALRPSTTDQKRDEVEDAPRPTSSLGPTMSEDASDPFAFPPTMPGTPDSAAVMNAEDILAFGKGLGASPLHGVLENTALFEIVVDNL